MPFFQCVLIFCLFILSPCFSHAENAVTLTEALEAIHVQNMLDDIYVLSSSQFEGRQAGTNGGKRSANFVAKRMERLGLIPTGSKTAQEGIAWYQQQSISATQFIQSPVLQFSVQSPKEQHQVLLNPTFGPDFLPILDSPSVNIMAPVVFVGYGIDDPAHGVNDYADIDVDNRIVMFLRGKPTTYTQWVTHEQKVKTAHQKGALAFMVLTGPVLDRYEARRGIGQAPLAIYSSPPDERPLTGIWLSGEMGNSLFKSGGLSLQDLQTQLNEKGSNRSQGLGMIASLKWESTNEPGTLINVMGAIPGIDSILREEAVIVGAHRDHFGKQGGLLFSGADDNASGTALLLEVTRIMSQIKPQPKRTIVFASFDGEERGLIGSKMHVKNPGYPLNKTVAMINVDHVGVGNGKLTVGLTRLPKSIGQQAATLANLEEKTDFYGYFPGGDHVPFFEAGVPTVTIVSSGKHTSFHQPSDTPDKIQPEILQNATQYVLALIWLLSDK